MTSNEQSPTNRRRLLCLLGLLIAVSLGASVFRKPIQRAVLLRALLSSDAPSEEAFRTLADETKDTFGFLARVWNSQRIPHRALVATYLKDNAGAQPDLYQRAEALLLSATWDVDASVRELALATLAQRKHPAVPRLGAALLHDVDPQMRLLGLQYLRKQPAATALGPVFNLLDDPDLRVVTTADSALRNWTRQDFGIRINLANDTGAAAGSDNVKIIQKGVRHWKEWWKTNQKDFPTSAWAAPDESDVAQRLPMADFALRDLNGKTVRFSDFNGRVVLLNFWTTWCTGCLVEIPALVELQKRNPDRLIVLGVSLDGKTEVDEHGHAVESHDDAEPEHERGETRANPADVRAKVGRFVQDKGINYRVLLDPESIVGRRFNGGELPVNVLIDSQGFVRRRFIGGRAIEALEAMLNDLIPRTARVSGPAPANR